MNRQCALTVIFCCLISNLALGQEPRGMLYDFSATWCGPCQQVAPIVEKLAREGLPIQKIDIDKHKKFADQYQIHSIPTFVLVIDGKEVDRTSGRLTESDLRRLIARIPKSDPEVASPAQNSAAGNSMSIPIDLGQPATIDPAPARQPVEETRVVENEHEPLQGLRDLLPFGKEQETPVVVRGNDSTLSNTPQQMPATGQPGQADTVDPMQASVRIRVVTDGRIDLGSGTIISSEQGHTLILTCAHIFKEFNADSRIEVDLFESGRGSQFIARMVKHDMESDVGLISIPTAGRFPHTAVAPVASMPHVGEPVAAIGCSGGEDPTRQQLRITDIDKYDGPHNILCTGVPVRGRSGGGLFNRHGEIIGVCSAADQQEQRGFYSGLKAIHHLLDECSLTQLYAPPATPAAPETRLAAAETTSAPSSNPALPEATTPVATATSAESHEAPVDVEAGDAEVVVIIRDRSDPETHNRVVIIHKASPKFFSYLSGELDQGAIDGNLLGANSRPATAPAISRSLRPAGSQKSDLLPTGLSRPIVPQRYTRSAASR